MGASAVVQQVDDVGPDDTIARRLRDLGFVSGEPVRLVARGPIGADPLLIQIGYTRFALRRAEAARVRVTPGDAIAGERFSPSGAPDSRAFERKNSDAVSGRDEPRPDPSAAAP